MSDITAMFMSALYDYGPEVLKQLGQGATEKLGGEFVGALKKRFWDAPQIDTSVQPSFPPTSSEKLLNYLQRQDRVLETTLRCLEQLTERVQGIQSSRPAAPIHVAIGILPTRDQRAALTDVDVQAVLNDKTPGTPQTIKSGFALAHLSRGNKHLAEIYAQSILKSNPVDPGAHFVLAHLLLGQPLRDVIPPHADSAEGHLATAAEAGLGPQSALPRAALRLDHYKYRNRRPPLPRIDELSFLFEAHRAEATSWPFKQLNQKLAVSNNFKKIWGD